ncbi:MAG TPA: glycosyltransferase [Tepidisphaeraceae bacterium]|jgi:GT2 family glycosyltransferase
MKLSCILTTRNHCDALSRTLDHLDHESGVPAHEREILVVDNGSTDGTADLLAGRRDVRVISLAENEGVPARNLALAAARGKYVAFLEDDVRPIGRALAQALTYLGRHPKTAAVVGRVVLPDGSADAPALPSVLMSGASVARMSAVTEVGGFAAEFFRQAADYELSFRLWRAGYRIQRFEDLQFAREATAPSNTSAVTCRMDLRNNLILCERYLPRPLRRAYRRDWMRRYALLARQDGHASAAARAIKEARIWARREAAVGRKTLGADAVESIFSLKSQRDRVTNWARAHRISRVCIADWSKNLFATWQACLAAGLEVEAILAEEPCFVGARYRKMPVIADHAAEGRMFDGILVSTVNPAQLEARAATLEARFHVPVLRLWEPTLMVAPPPKDLTSQPTPSLRKIDKAA